MIKNNLLLCALILSIAIVGINCKSNRYSEIPGEDGFKVIIEETNNVPTEFYPDSLAKHRSESWRDIIDSAPMRYSKFFTKKTGVTTIKIKNNKTVQFIDNESDENFREEDPVEHNFYMLFIPEIDSHLVLRSFFNTDFNYALISNKTGDVQYIGGIPYLSPDKNRLATATKDLGDRFDPNAIQIFDIVSGNCIKKFNHEFDWGPDNLRWINNDTFIVDKYILDNNMNEIPAGHVIFKLVNAK